MLAGAPSGGSQVRQVEAVRSLLHCVPKTRRRKPSPSFPPLTHIIGLSTRKPRLLPARAALADAEIDKLAIVTAGAGLSRQVIVDAPKYISQEKAEVTVDY